MYPQGAVLEIYFWFYLAPYDCDIPFFHVVKSGPDLGGVHAASASKPASPQSNGPSSTGLSINWTIPAYDSEINPHLTPESGVNVSSDYGLAVSPPSISCLSGS